AMLAACSTPRPQLSRGAEVVSTVVPITLFTRAVAGDCVTVAELIPPALGPHDFQARPSDLAVLRQARVLVNNGLGLEGFLSRMITAAGNPQLLVIDSSRGVAPLAASGHDHDHGEVNPHIWLDPLRASAQVAAIRDGLIKADPACADGYRRNAQAYIEQLMALDREFAAQLKPYRGKTFVAFHDVAPYFAERYGLKGVYLVDVPARNPSPADLQRVMAAVKRSQLKALLSEPQQGQRTFNALAQDLGVSISVFDPLERADPAATRDPQTYFKVMRSNVANLLKALQG
ncbi:MAG: metal ABC transporter solute-binding protein, Zn/Mn family, partial [Prochlorococcaceae cyanobacterium]